MYSVRSGPPQPRFLFYQQLPRTLQPSEFVVSHSSERIARCVHIPRPQGNSSVLCYVSTFVSKRTITCLVLLVLQFGNSATAFFICSVGPLRFSAMCERERDPAAARSRIMLCRFPHSHNDVAMQQSGLETDSCPQGNAPADSLAGRLSPSRT